MRNLERCCQLHERVEIINYVDSFGAKLLTDDGNTPVFGFKGESMLAALVALDAYLKNYTLEMVRSYSKRR